MTVIYETTNAAFEKANTNKASTHKSVVMFSASHCGNLRGYSPRYSRNLARQSACIRSVSRARLIPSRSGLSSTSMNA